MGFPFPRFISKRDRARFHAGENGCHLWTGFIMGGGYPAMNLSGQVVGAHRISWVIHNEKEISDGYEVDHLCGNTLCVNPEHLEAVTRAENLRRSFGNHIDQRGSATRDDKTCRLCARVGRRAFRWEKHRWYCTNEIACASRREKAERTKLVLHGVDP